MIEKGLRDYLVTDAGLLALVGYDVYPFEASENLAEPYLVYEMIEADEPRDLSGNLLSRRYVFALTGCAVSYDAAKAIGDAIKALVPASVSTTLDGDSVVIFFTDQGELPEYATGPDNALHYWVTRELTVLVR